MKNKKIKTPMESHTPKNKIGMGDHYGSGIKNKIGRMREDSMGMMPVDRKGLNNPPRSLA
jgi:hypothetical protein